jgi:hypothetical protein
MYHSPGLRDGVSTQGTCVRPCPPEVLGAESAIDWIIFAGNKLGRTQVITVDWDFRRALRSRYSRDGSQRFWISSARAAFVNG